MERLYTIDEVCKLITLIQEINKDGHHCSETTRWFKPYLKALCETFNNKVSIHHRSLIRKACDNAKYRTSPNSLLNALDKIINK